MSRYNFFLILVISFTGCYRRTERPGCTEADLAAITAACKAKEIEARCDDNPKVKCPEIVRECLDEINRWDSKACD